LQELYFEPKNATPPSKAAVQSMAQQLFESLAFIHSVDVCHHDLSEANVMWGRSLCVGQNKLTLIDFGWAGRLHRKVSPASAPRKKYCDDINAAAKLMRDLAQNHPGLYDYMQKVYGDSQNFTAQQIVKTLRNDLTS